MNNVMVHMTVEVFRTDIDHAEAADKVIERLLDSYPDFKINFDLEDCDRVLRVEGSNVPVAEIETLLRAAGYSCEVLQE